MSTTTEDAPETPSRNRLAVIDDVKAAAILAVVLQHALPAPWEPATSVESLASALIQYHVPAFLMVSGFLCSHGRRLTTPELGHRLARLLPPYLVASLFWWSVGATRPFGEDPGLAWMLITASAVPIYYYVFVQTACLLLLWPISRAPRALQLGLLAALLLWHAFTAWHPEARPDVSFFWEIRSPLTFFHYFLAGHLLAGRHGRRASARGTEAAAPAAARMHPATDVGIAPSRSVAIGCAIALGVYLATYALPGDAFLRGGPALRALCAFGVVGLVATASAAGRHVPAAAFLGPATYTLFLYHFPFSAWLFSATRGWVLELAIPVRFLGPLFAAALIVVVGRRVLGRHSARWLGC